MTCSNYSRFLRLKSDTHLSRQNRANGTRLPMSVHIDVANVLHTFEVRMGEALKGHMQLVVSPYPEAWRAYQAREYKRVRDKIKAKYADEFTEWYKLESNARFAVEKWQLAFNAKKATKKDKPKIELPPKPEKPTYPARPAAKQLYHWVYSPLDGKRRAVGWRGVPETDSGEKIDCAEKSTQVSETNSSMMLALPKTLKRHEYIVDVSPLRKSGKPRKWKGPVFVRVPNIVLCRPDPPKATKPRPIRRPKTPAGYGPELARYAVVAATGGTIGHVVEYRQWWVYESVNMHVPGREPILLRTASREPPESLIPARDRNAGAYLL